MISDTVINFLFKTSYVTMPAMLCVMYDTELQCRFVSNTISGLNWIAAPIVFGVGIGIFPCLQHVCNENLSF